MSEVTGNTPRLGADLRRTFTIALDPGDMTGHGMRPPHVPDSHLWIYGVVKATVYDALNRGFRCNSNRFGRKCE